MPGVEAAVTRVVAAPNSGGEADGAAAKGGVLGALEQRSRC